MSPSWLQICGDLILTLGLAQKFSMDPWDAHFRSTVPVLNDPRIQDLNLAHGLMLLKSAVTRPYATPPFADSTADFQLTQAWNGWTYSFQRLPADPSELAEWVPSTGSDQLGIVSPDAPEFIMDLHHLRKPYIDDSTQAGMVSRRGERFAAIRSFKAPRTLHVAVDLTYRSEHACGDGTRLSLIQTGASGERAETLVEYMTMDEGFAEFVGATTLRAGNSLHVVSDPLGDDECDRVEVHLRVTRIEVENQSWSRLARRAALAAHEERRQSAQQEDRPVETNSTWTLVPVERPSEDSMFNIALIFDRNRFPHAMSVIRSIQHFSAGSRKLVFHLIATMDTRDELTEYFADTDMTLKLYDHGLCAYVAKAVLPFSDPEIHVSAHCKMFLTEIIKDAERVLYLDTDTTVLSDLSACYDRPTDNPAALVSMAVDMGDACQNNPNACWPIGMHWRVPPGLECGNVPARHVPSRHAPESCAEEGELETLQVNGGVALFELARMRDAGFLERYVQSIVHHYQLMRNAPARWGEQDFINSFFRLYPDDLEFLPCGCNYQWFGARREVKCGAQPVQIAHHWYVAVQNASWSGYCRVDVPHASTQGSRHRGSDKGAVQRSLSPFRRQSRRHSVTASARVVGFVAWRTEYFDDSGRQHPQLSAARSRLLSRLCSERIRYPGRRRLANPFRNVRRGPGRLARIADLSQGCARGRQALRSDHTDFDF